MCVAALFSGIALANARLGAVHGFAGVLGGTTGHPHGAICARLLPFVMEANIRALEGRGRHEAPRAIRRDRPDPDRRSLRPRRATASNGSGPCAPSCRFPPARGGPDPQDPDPIIPAARRASSMQGNPVELPDRVLLEILELAM